MLGELPDGAPFIVMEFLNGRSLGDLIDAEVALRIDRAIDITRQICSALAVAHGLGIVHRDIEPDNIFLVQRSRGDDFVKVFDFGISKVRDLGLDANLTKTGAALGTPAYMAPEQAQGLKSLDHRADILAVGVMLFEMLAGRLPFEADTYAALLLRMMTSPPPQLTELRGDVPEGLAAIIDSTMAKQPEDRPLSMAELSSRLAAFAAIDAQPELLDSRDDRDRSGEVKTHRARLGETELHGGHDLGAARSSAPAPAPTAAEAPGERDADETATTQPARRSVPGWAFYLGAALIAVAVAGWWLLRAPAQGTVEAPAAAEVRVRVRVSPADATILLAGTVFPNPMDAARPRSLDPISLVIERDGYRTMRRTVVLDQDRSYDFELAREPEQREVEVAARGAVALDVTLHELEDNITIHTTTRIERPPVPAGVFYGGVALTLVSLGVGAYVGVTALGLADQARDRPDPRLPPDTGAVEESALLADIFFSIGGVVGITAVVLAFMTDFADEPDPPDDAEAASLRISPAGIEGTF